MPSRDISDLRPEVEQATRDLLELCAAVRIDLLVTSTVRSLSEQGTLYRMGRTVEHVESKIEEMRENGFKLLANELAYSPIPSSPGRIVTMAGPGESWHNWGYAIDVVPLRYGKPVWSTNGEDGKLWNELGLLGERCGFIWGGRWERFRDWPHFQLVPEGLRLATVMRQYEIETGAAFGYQYA